MSKPSKRIQKAMDNVLRRATLRKIQQQLHWRLRLAYFKVASGSEEKTFESLQPKMGEISTGDGDLLAASTGLLHLTETSPTPLPVFPHTTTSWAGNETRHIPLDRPQHQHSATLMGEGDFLVDPHGTIASPTCLCSFVPNPVPTGLSNSIFVQPFVLPWPHISTGLEMSLFNRATMWANSEQPGDSDQGFDFEVFLNNTP